MSAQRFLLKGGILPDGTSSDLLIVDGVISSISPTISDAHATQFDVSGSILLPGLVDLHTHLRRPQNR